VDALAQKMKALEGDGLTLLNLSNKGLKAWPDADTSGMHLTDQFRCRFMAGNGKTDGKAVAALAARTHEAKLEYTKVENLYTFDGVNGFSLGQGE
jgi:isocitrate dehydrogenase